jgi:hypothetical protein
MSKKSSAQFLSKKEFVFLVALFVAAILIRSVNMEWGLPGQNYRYSAYVADEIGILYASLLLGRGAYLTYILQNYPFFYYISFVVMGGYFVAGLLFGFFDDLADFQAQYIIDASQLILVGRYFILVSASLTVVVTYLVARRLFGKRGAFFSSIFMLFSFGHVMYSQIFRLDSFLPLLFLLTFWAILSVKETPAGKLYPYIVCAVLVALTVGTKVTAWAVVIPFFLLPFLTDNTWGIGWPKVDRRFLFAVYLFFALYIIQIAPVLPEIAEIMSGISSRLDKSGTFGNPADLSPYRYSIVWYLTHILPQQMGVFIYLLAIGGLVLMITDRKRRPYIWLFYALIFAYLLPVGYATRTTWRDMLPLLPFLSMGAGYGFDRLLQRIAVRWPGFVRQITEPMLIMVILLLILIWPVTTIVQNKYLLLQDDTREIATSWIETNVPSGASLLVEAYGPAILDSEQQNELYYQVEALGKQVPRTTRPTYSIFELTAGLAEERSLLLPNKLIPFLLDNKIEYVVVSSGYYARFYNEAVDRHFAKQGLQGREFHDLIANNLELVQTFVPNWRNQPGPVIQIYRVPDNLTKEEIFVPGSFDPYLSLTPPASAVGYFQTSPH